MTDFIRSVSRINHENPPVGRLRRRCSRLYSPMAHPDGKEGRGGVSKPGRHDGFKKVGPPVGPRKLDMGILSEKTWKSTGNLTVCH